MNWLRWQVDQLEWPFVSWRRWSWRLWALLGSGTFAITFALVTWFSLADMSALKLQVVTSKPILLDRQGAPLAEATGEWNVQDRIPLYEIPQRLQQAVLTAEDKRFYHHKGVDWVARVHAVWQGVKAGRNVRGASSITEQVVRMLVPRRRTLWSKWIEGFDAKRLEHVATKSDILEFYLNQVPYASNRRGVVAAAKFYFNRDLETLDGREMLTLAILPRAPSGLDPYRGGARVLERRSIHLASAMREAGHLTGDEWERIIETPLTLERPARVSSIGHFRAYAAGQIAEKNKTFFSERIQTTLDSGLMQFSQDLLDQRVADLAPRRVKNAAALVIDRRNGDILTWNVAGADKGGDTPGRYLDAVRVPRQPGSALKPFLYAATFDAGWSPGQSIEDAPLSEAVGTGMHSFNNYSRQFYGEVSIRQALGNSLNIPAVHAVNFIGPERYLDLLHRLGFNSLTRGAGFYGDGLALGNGEVSLLELVRGFAALANQGRTIELHALRERPLRPDVSEQVFTPQAATMVSDILSDPWARAMEFGRYSLLDLPVQTAVKTGTSTDYRDAWAVGYDSRYVVGIWMGNLDQSPMDGITGSTGPGMALRGLFAYLNRDQNTSKLPLNSELFLQENCAFPAQDCSQIHDLQSASTKPRERGDIPEPFIMRPTKDLRLAYDPRMPKDRQTFRFKIGGAGINDEVTWTINGETSATTKGGDYNWPVERGYYSVVARVATEQGKKFVLGPVDFTVR
tara:strand:- start:72380 stop:74599 length:2220 start_codon:yes stop_codon:yes gene_type:complete